ncbi:MAG: hypothetical protein N2D54_09830, partial [Chloroflexota bacterium]
MLRLTDIKLPLDHANEELQSAVLAKLGIPPEELIDVLVFKRSHDARRKNEIKLIYTLHVEVKREKEILRKKRKNNSIRVAPDTSYKFVAQAPKNLSQRPIVIGSGPCGLFAGLVLAQMGFKPIILERGKPVRERTADTFGFWRQRELDPESNVQFGEGGAGTFSDGKLHTQMKDKKYIGRKVLEEFVKAGAPKEILYISKPHIGTLKLVKIVQNIRDTIQTLGGEYRFQSLVQDLLIEDSKLRGVILANGETLYSEHVILAVGHSARDTFQMLHERGVAIEAKPFSMGLRIEHPQPIIDTCQ